MMTPRLHQSHENVYPCPLITSGDTAPTGRISKSRKQHGDPERLLYEFVPQLSWR